MPCAMTCLKQRLMLLILNCTSLFATPITDQHFSGNEGKLDLSPYYDNKAFGTYPGEASFDTSGQSYPSPRHSNSPWYTSTSTGIAYSFPGYLGSSNPDNVISNGQTIRIPPSCSGNAFSVSFLIAGDVEFSTVSGNATFQYSDGSNSSYEIRTLAWYSWLTLNRGEIVFPYRFTNKSVNWNTSHIFERTAALTPAKQLQSITLPIVEDGESRLHVFAISLWSASEAKIDVQHVRPTQKWFESGEQVVEVVVNNFGEKCVMGDGINIEIQGKGFTTTTPGRVKRLCPGDQKMVNVGVRGESGGLGDVEVVIEGDGIRRSVGVEGVEIGFIEWNEDLDTLAKHEAPDWYTGAKFGIFIHWGVYSVTGWGNSTPYESYAEWFWWYSTHHPQADRSDFYDYRLNTYGANWSYDDTFPSFTASKFDPKAWVALFAEAGAQYFVITSKHHDGFALFDTGETSNRSSLHYGPKRDLLKELFDAAATYQPFNPDFGLYGFDQLPTSSDPGTSSWPGILARNPYTNATEPYTGHVPVSDFITDVMLPQMQTLAFDYATEIMWCDIGAANASASFAADWYTETRKVNRQITINSRCGLAEVADFDTPEYATFSSAQRRKWESNLGMDPYSYGYNRATKDAEYMTAAQIVKMLVDVKNGNLLLDIGPRYDGTIVDIETNNLREAGRWIRAHGEALFNTTYWFVQSEFIGDAADVRFTQTNEAFYILFLEKPTAVNGDIRLPVALPIVSGDELSLLAIDGGESLEWSVSPNEDGRNVLKIQIDDGLLDREEFCWVFKIKYA
ncbi:glycoside hydrolase family 29 protein [Xylariaceae sp. FL1272]|nr:glycoside hydrolase family 29 protein [Xylariaceae sp. FL1272]